MKQNNKCFLKLLSCLLAGIMLFALVACVSEGETKESEQTSGTVSGTDEYVNPIETVKFDGDTVRFMVRESGKHRDELFVDGDDGSKVNGALYAREMKVEDMLGVTIEFDRLGGNDDHGPIHTIEALVNSDDSTYDVFSSSFFITAPYSSHGLFTDLYECDYLDLEQGYWSQYYTEKAQIGDKLYTCTGSAAISSIRFMFCVYFNKQLIEDYKLEDPYEIVLNGEWTIDKEYEIVRDIYEDVNRNNEKDADDFYGVSLFNGFLTDGFTSSCDLMMIENVDGTPQINVDVERYQEAIEKVNALIFNSEGTYSAAFDEMQFSSSLRIFWHSWIYAAECANLRNMTDEYGIIPYPKLNETQAEYYTYAEDQISCFAIPVTAKDPSLSGAVLEALAYVSENDVMPVYYEEVLKTRYFEGENNGKILDMMRANYKLDTAWIYCNFINDMPALFRNMMAQGKTNFASRFQANREVYQDRLDELVKAFESIE